MIPAFGDRIAFPFPIFFSSPISKSIRVLSYKIFNSKRNQSLNFLYSHPNTDVFHSKCLMALLSSSVTACLASNLQPTFSLSQSACNRGRKNDLDAELNTFTHLLPSFCSSHGVSFSLPCYPGVQSQGREHSSDVIDKGERDDGTQKRDIEDVKLATSYCVNSQVPRVEPSLSVIASPETRIHAITLRIYRKDIKGVI